MEKIGFLYFNNDNEMVCNEYFRLEDTAIVGYVLSEDEVQPLETDFLSFEDLAQYYQGRNQAVLVFNVTEADKAKDTLGVTLKEFSLAKGYEDDEQKLADELEKSGVFDTEYPEQGE